LTSSKPFDAALSRSNEATEVAATAALPLHLHLQAVAGMSVMK